jgi:branched-chain amino acid transport system substrate-binding protein
MRKKVLSILSAISLVAGLTVIASPAAQAACAGKIKIAYQGPVSGPDAALGANQLNGVKFALKRWLKANPNANVDATVVEVDDQGDRAQGPIVAPRVAQDECIVALVGPAYSGASFGSLPIYLQAGLPVITPSATNPGLNAVGKEIFHRIVLTDDFQGPAAARLMQNQVKNLKLFLVHDQTDYGFGLHKLIKQALSASRLAGEDSAPRATTDYAPILAKIKRSKANAVFYSGYFADAAVFVKALRDSGSKAVFGSGDGTLDNEFIKLARKAAEGALLTAPAVPFEAADAKLAKTFTTEMGAAPGVYTTESYDAANFFLAAIKAGNTTRAAINNYISTKSFKGLSKNVKFDKDGEVSGVDVNGFVIRKGKIVLLGPIR